jgi:hypothetical protein
MDDEVVVAISSKGSYGAGVQPEEFDAPYRLGWVGIVRQLSIATALRYAVPAALLVSLVAPLARAPLRGLAVLLGGAALGAQILIRCPRCRALWPSSSDSDGQRKPCARCKLRWGQEDNLPDPESL